MELALEKSPRDLPVYAGHSIPEEKKKAKLLPTFSPRRILTSITGIAMLLLTAIGVRQWYSHRHYLGKGAPGPTQALTTFADAIEHYDYHTIRELLAYQRGVCGGMELIAVDVSDRSVVHLSIVDHPDNTPNSMTNPDSRLYRDKDIYTTYAQLWKERILPFRWFMLHYTAYLRSLNLDTFAGSNKIKLSLPRLAYIDFPNLIALDPGQTNDLTLIQKGGRWYIYNFSCGAMAVIVPDEQEPDYASVPLIDEETLLEMCAEGRESTEP